MVVALLPAVVVAMVAAAGVPMFDVARMAMIISLLLLLL
jgi:hypothetical protein